MPGRVIDQLLPKNLRLNNYVVFAGFLVLSFFIRFPFVFRDYIDRDESTFILVAQAWVDGFLPYTLLWDLKPPVTFLFFSAMIVVFGKSLIAIRLAGIVTVAIIGFFSYRICNQFVNKNTAIWSGILTIYLISLFGSLQGVMSEHISMLFFMPAMFLLIRYKSVPVLLLAGILMGAAAMSKLNLAYPVLALGLYLIFIRIRNRVRLSNYIAVLAFGLGVILSIGATILPYFLESKTLLWWNAVVLAPLEYSDTARHSIGNFLPLLLILSIILFIGIRLRALETKKIDIQLLLVAIAGVVLAFYRGGRINGHYLIQLYPLLTILVGIIAGSTDRFRRLHLCPYMVILMLLLPIESYREYHSVIRNKLETNTLVNGEGYTVPAYIRDTGLPIDHILFLEYHIGYWFLDKLPPTMAATHPTNLCRDETFKYFNNPRKTSIQELKYIMDEIGPPLVITRRKWNIFDKKEVVENTYLRTYLEEHYVLEKVIDNAEIHRRLK